jgi:hypothetical protein
MTERIDDGALEHPPDRVRSNGVVRVFPHWAPLTGSRGQRSPVHRDGIVYEQLDPRGRETCGRRAAPAVRGRLAGEEELGAVNRQSRDDVPAIEVHRTVTPAG